MKNRMVALLCLVLIVALVPVGANPATAAPLPAGQQSAGVRANTSNLVTEYLSIPAAAFTPNSQFYDYENHGRYIKAFGTAVSFRAPLYFPQEAILKRISACFLDDSTTTAGTVKLYSVQLQVASLVLEMASVLSSNGPDFKLSSDETISPAAVNNEDLAYWLELNLPASTGPGNNVWGCGVTIEYYRRDSAAHILSIPGAAFDHPYQDGYNSGNIQAAGKLKHFDDGGGTHGVYVAQVNLPHGAVVTKMTMYYQDTNLTHAVNLYLEMTRFEVAIDMATITSEDNLHQTETTGIIQSTIDNFNYGYWAYVNLPPTNLELWAVTIEYTPPANNYDIVDISDAAFTPFFDGYDYENHGRWLFHRHSAGGGTLDGVYVAPVNLRQGAKIEEFGAVYYDASVLSGTAKLARTRLGSFEVMAEAPSTSLTGWNNSYQSVIANDIVDNTQYNYFVFWVLPVTSVHNPPVSGDIVGCRMLIGYANQYYAYLPAVQK